MTSRLKKNRDWANLVGGELNAKWNAGLKKLDVNDAAMQGWIKQVQALHGRTGKKLTGLADNETLAWIKQGPPPAQTIPAVTGTADAGPQTAQADLGAVQLTPPVASPDWAPSADVPAQPPAPVVADVPPVAASVQADVSGGMLPAIDALRKDPMGTLFPGGLGDMGPAAVSQGAETNIPFGPSGAGEGHSTGTGFTDQPDTSGVNALPQWAQDQAAQQGFDRSGHLAAPDWHKKVYLAPQVVGPSDTPPPVDTSAQPGPGSVQWDMQFDAQVKATRATVAARIAEMEKKYPQVVPTNVYRGRPAPPPADQMTYEQAIADAKIKQAEIDAAMGGAPADNAQWASDRAHVNAARNRDGLPIIMPKRPGQIVTQLDAVHELLNMTADSNSPLNKAQDFLDANRQVK